MSATQDKLLPLRVLIVEDLENDALLLVDQLRSGGYTIDWKRVDTESALIDAMQQPVDIVFSDFSMPRFSGARALEIIRRHDSDIPFIYISGTIGEETAVSAMKSGAQDYVMKGQLTRLLPAVERELRDVKLRRERRQSEQTLRKLSLVVNQTADSVFITDPEGRIEYVNPAFEKLTGYSADEIIGNTPALLRSGLQDKVFYQQLWETIHRGEIFRGTLINKHKNGALFHEEKVITPLKDGQERITHFVSIGRDITARVLAEQERTQLVAILEATPDLVATLNPDGCLRYLNGAGRQMLGLDARENIEGQCLQDIFPERIAQQLILEAIPAAHRDGVWSGETVLQAVGGKELPVSQVILAHHNKHGDIEYLSTIARDITERKHYESALQHQATHDRLTGLPNRFFLADRFKCAMDQARRTGSFVAVLFFDIDNFKRVNDSLGHAAGDSLLQQVAKRLTACLRPNDTVARHGGDEFTIIINELKQVENILIVLQKICAKFERPLMVESHEIYTTFSTGIALFPHDGNQVEDLLRHADTAMYRAKSVGTGQYRFYAPEMNARGHEFLTLEADLRHALEQDEFRLYYQPQMDLRNGYITGAEGLIRWQHPTRGLLFPIDFVPLLESTGLIVSVGEWVLRQACKFHRSIREAQQGELCIAVNVSAAQFTDKDLLDKIRRALDEEGMQPHNLELEITENVVMQNPTNAAELLRSFHAMGVRTAIDDFGTGYSSLAYLKRFPLNVLKIDQTFIRDLVHNAGDTAIVDASITLAKKFGLKVVAEGVETAEQFEFLRIHDCDLAQGYFISRAVPEAEFAKLVLKT